jgi:hypothetical protein
MLAITAATTVAGAYEQKQQAEYGEGVAEYNARKLENEAQQTRNAATDKERALRQEAAELQARQRAQFAASGIDVGSETPINLQTDTETLAEADAYRIREAGDLQFQSLIEQGELGLSAARATRKMADRKFSLLTGGFMGVAGIGGKAGLFSKAAGQDVKSFAATGGPVTSQIGRIRN